SPLWHSATLRVPEPARYHELDRLPCPLRRSAVPVYSESRTVPQWRGGQIGAGQLRLAGDPRAKLMAAGALPGSACEVGRDDVSGVPVQAAAAPVTPHRGPRVRMGGCLLDIAEWYPGVQGGGDECVPERVGRDGLADPGAAGGFADDPPGGVPVQPPVVSGHEYRPFGPFADGQVDRPGSAR